jgi:mRNA interferase MazF
MQKEIWYANLNPTKGTEQSGIRPVVIISGNTMNEHLGLSIVMPLSTKVKNYMGCLVLKKNSMNGLKEDSEILTFQIRTISQDRLIEKIGKITDNELQELKKNLNEILYF